MRGSKLSFKAFSGAVLFVCMALFTSVARADSGLAELKDPADPEQLKAEIVKIYCADGGQLTRCVGLSGSDCPSVVAPIVEQCMAKSISKKPADRGQEIYFCFSGKFSEQYGSRLEKSEECMRPAIIEGALAPNTPELEKRLTPLAQAGR